MKRGLTLLLASLMLTVGLTACGGDTKNPQNDRNDSAVTGGAGDNAPNDSANYGDTNGALADGSQNDLDDTMRDIEDGLDDAMRDAGDAVDDLMDGGHPKTATSQLPGTPGWNGNLRQPDYPGGFSGTL